MNNQHPNWLLEGFHPISTVAIAYFPDLQASSSAIRRFRSEIQKHPRLARELAEAEYHPHTLMLSPRQISIIIRHWGMPNEVGLLIAQKPELRETLLNRDRKFD